jgi:catechol 2,3-dioxygenase-like lactoylglutathione lyase family enzyme
MSLDTLRHDHVALRVADYEATVRWYTTKLGFSVDLEWPFGDLQLAYLSRGSVKIELLAGADPAPQERFAELDNSFGAERVHHVCLAVDDLDSTLAELAERDVPLLAEPFVVGEIGRRRAFIEDNAGNLIELSAPS